jgi:hypothetical protein
MTCPPCWKSSSARRVRSGLESRVRVAHRPGHLTNHEGCMFLARVTFLEPEQGGRHTPPQSGYHPQIDAGGEYTSCAIESLNEETVFEFGKEYMVRLRLLFPEFYRGRFAPGNTYGLYGLYVRRKPSGGQCHDHRSRRVTHMNKPPQANRHRTHACGWSGGRALGRCGLGWYCSGRREGSKPSL